ncbi:hypothetical protein Taro_052152 [Colocasia esculenta]|uniref:Uncharacterized protein n=1 Tax=Colocasia esculenta TaxID=4460 RepID=A0A843XIV9_COLES|nr:hypothetical protein [Colocasia esculenta]
MAQHSPSWLGRQAWPFCKAPCTFGCGPRLPSIISTSGHLQVPRAVSGHPVTYSVQMPPAEQAQLEAHRGPVNASSVPGYQAPSMQSGYRTSSPVRYIPTREHIKALRQLAMVTKMARHAPHEHLNETAELSFLGRSKKEKLESHDLPLREATAPT